MGRNKMERNKSSLKSEFLDFFENTIFVNSDGFFNENKDFSELQPIFPYLTMLNTKTPEAHILFETGKEKYLAILMKDSVFAGKIKKNSNTSKILYMKSEFIKEYNNR